MDVSTDRQGGADSPDDALAAETCEPIVSYHEPRPGTLVLTERNNTDGWLASDVAVDLER
ncbi:hypothetical protein [Natronobiforma cellulositropha]|uniref:hypothetical protein n=1 Tax=Natronobiforma cellulositropha TaxID=1679076 RepID=UPI0021D59179|nr:hypothetical protein [Natronobiforma cellulositropha]